MANHDIASISRWLKTKLILLLPAIALLVSRCAAQESCHTLVSSTPRGFLCLQCLHKLAPGGAHPFTQVLLDSCLQDVALGFVTDGSFGYNAQEIETAIREITSAGRTFYLHLYVYNGPAQRRWRSGFFRSFAVMDPVVFRARIKSDPKLRRIFQNEVKKLVPILKAAQTAGVHVSLAPGLEDNLDNSGFQQAISLIRMALPRDLLPSLVRSSCGDCAIGNQSAVPKGVSSEIHTSDSSFSTQSGFVSTDGEYFVLDHDRPSNAPSTLTLSSLIPSLQRAIQLNDIYLLWVPKFQDSTADFSPTSPDTRVYRAPTPEDAQELIRFLRAS